MKRALDERFLLVAEKRHCHDQRDAQRDENPPDITHDSDCMAYVNAMGLALC
jgi:hypothetical protein